MIGIDISSWQTGLDLSKSKDYFDFCIMKATEGVGFTDTSFSNFVVQSTKLEKLIGAYHFARPDIHGTIKGMEEEATWFCNVVETAGIVGNGILVLDWETQPMDREDLITAWMNKVVELIGVIPFIYGSKSKLSTTAFNKIIKDWPIWMAAWPSMEKLPISTANKWVDNYKPKRTNIDWRIWQFSATGSMEGFNGNVDFDWTDMSVIDWKVAAGQYNMDVYPEKEVISEDMQWAIDLGIIKGNGKGYYGVKDILTKEQIITILKRYNDTI